MELAIMLQMIRVMEALMPILYPVVKDLIGRGIDPATIDWGRLYGKDIEVLRAQVDAQQQERNDSHA